MYWEFAFVFMESKEKRVACQEQMSTVSEKLAVCSYWTKVQYLFTPASDTHTANVLKKIYTAANQSPLNNQGFANSNMPATEMNGSNYPLT